MKHPKMLNEVNIEELREWVREFPYSQNLRILLAQKIKMEGGSDDADEVIDAAVYATDRGKLHQSLLTAASQKSNKTKNRPDLQSPPAPGTEPDLTTGKAVPEDPGLTSEKDAKKNGHGPVDDMDVHIEGAVKKSQREDEPIVSTEADPAGEPRPTPVSGDLPESVRDENEGALGEEVDTRSADEAEKDSSHEENGHAKEELEDVAAALISQHTKAETSEPVPESSTALSSFSKWLMTLPSAPVASGHDKKPGDEGNSGLAGKDLISTSLAELLTAQGHFQEAISMYEKLQLKYPEKSTYFAAQIEKLKAL